MSVERTHLELNLFAEKPEIVLRHHLRIRGKHDLEVALSEPFLEVVADLGTFSLRPVVCLDVDFGREFLKLPNPVFQSRGGYENEMRAGIAFLLQVRDERYDLDRLAETCIKLSA